MEWNNTASADSFGPGMKTGWQKLSPNPERFEEVMNKILAMWRAQPNWTLAQLRSIRAKTLVCAGDHDLVRPEHTADLAAAIPGAEMWVVPNASHSAMIERSDIVNSRVLEFLKQ